VGTSRLTLRRAIGDRTGDFTLCTATDAGSTVAFTDVVRFGDRGTNAPSLLNRIGYFADLDTEVRTAAFNATTRALTFAPALDSATQEGDELELWSIADRLGSISAIHRLINDAIRAVADLAGDEAYDTASTFNWREPELSIPTTWSELGGVEWTDFNQLPNDIRRTDAKVRFGRRTVALTGRGGALANGRSVSVWGYERALPLDADDDETAVDPEWIVDTVASAMALAQSWRSSDRAAEERRANFWASQATTLRRKVGPPRRGWGIALP
jgi:hypothetical protein